jgi:two-component system, NtrC family, response regulator AtoC
MSDLDADHLSIKDHRGFVAGLSPAMQTLETVISEIAPTNIPILLFGESGTGKEVFAHRIHRLSQCSDQPFVRISCASANPASLSLALGPILNGGAISTRSASGTVFLDEISELDLTCQRNLLYALPDGDGDAQQGTLAIRVVSATARNLDEEISAGSFRKELYYRINGVCLRLPPLRERKEDIPLLVEWFLTKHADQLERPRPLLSPRTIRRFLDHSWPGNIRELENVVKKIVALGDEQLAIGEWEVVAPAPHASEQPSNDRSLKAVARAASREAERELILKALTRTHWNRKRAAQELQISYKSLLYKLKQIAFEDSEIH